MEPSLELLRQLRREEVDDARRMSPEMKLRAGGELFDMACEVTLCGIRWQFPHYTAQQAMDELERRLRMARRGEARAHDAAFQ
jgi:hypothetical protein